jgi:hypothetical protein
MLKDIVSVNPLTGHPAYFSQVRVDPELGTVVWPNGADLDPDVVYGRLVPKSDELVSR